MSKENVNVDYDSADSAAQAAENVMNEMQDIKDGMSDGVNQVAADTPTTPEEFILSLIHISEPTRPY